MQPVIILVRPQLGENIGAAARVMANFGLDALRIVAPRDGWPNPRAEALAGHAKDMLDAAQIYETVAEAVADLSLTFATSSRDRAMSKPVAEPDAAVMQMRAAVADGMRCGILFGAERTGLENEELMSADAVLTIPTSGTYASLNLSHAVGIMAYEWSKGVAVLPQPAPHVPATKGELEGLFGHLEQVLDAADYFKEPTKKPFMWRNIRATLARANMNGAEVQTWRGIIRALSGQR